MLNFIFIIKYSQVVLEKQNEKIQTKKATPKGMAQRSKF